MLTTTDTSLTTNSHYTSILSTNRVKEPAGQDVSFKGCRFSLLVCSCSLLCRGTQHLHQYSYGTESRHTHLDVSTADLCSQCMSVIHAVIHSITIIHHRLDTEGQTTNHTKFTNNIETLDSVASSVAADRISLSFSKNKTSHVYAACCNVFIYKSFKSILIIAACSRSRK